MDEMDSMDQLAVQSGVHHVHKVHPVHFLHLAWLHLGLLTALSAPAQEPTPTPALPRFTPLVLAHYYPWYGNPDGPTGQWLHWNSNQPHYDSFHVPTLGYYDSRDPEVLRQHIAWAKQAGLDAFIASWWGIGSPEDATLPLLLSAAEEADFKITIMLEVAAKETDLRAQVEYVLAEYTGHPAWLHEGGDPVLFVYGRVVNAFTPAQLRGVFDRDNLFVLCDTMDENLASAFDGVHFYNPISDLAAYEAAVPGFRQHHQVRGRLFAASVVPGYDDTLIRNPGLSIPRDEGAIYIRMWAAAAGADWVTVTSFNEWHEGTEIEPSVEEGYRWIGWTADGVRWWKGLQDQLGATWTLR